MYFDQTVYSNTQWNFLEASLATWHILSRHTTRVKGWLGCPIYEAYLASHKSKTDTCSHLIGPHGTSRHASTADWSVHFLCCMS
jgi:hypothetical protein